MHLYFSRTRNPTLPAGLVGLRFQRMRTLMKVSYYRLLALVLLSGLTSVSAYSQLIQKKIPAQENTSSFIAKSPIVGDCQLGSATSDLDINNVRARMYNNGGLFWRGSGNVYTVPKDGEANSIFAAGIWIGGIDPDGELRFAGTAYGPFEYWPGPIDEFGNPPADCSEYDHIYKISRADLVALDETGVATEDIENWPYDLGAPTIDGDGDPTNYDVEGGDRPELIGDQMLWWVMNEAGNVKGWSQTEPIGLEIQVTAFAFDRPGPVYNSTFYKYKIIHKGDAAMSDVHLGIWTDPDLGNAADDMVGSDTTRGMGIVFNGTDNDQGFDGYGLQPPALGYDFLQGPLVPDTTYGGYNVWTDPDGSEHPGKMRLKMSSFVYYNSDSSAQGNPNGNTRQAYDYMRAIWRDGTRMTFGGTGYGGSVPTNYMFPGNVADRAYWSEENTDNMGSRNTPADRRFLMSVGPFDMNPGNVQEIIFGIVWSRSSDRLSSYRQLLLDDIQVQGFYNNNFQARPPIDAPIVSADELDGQVILSWENLPSSNNFLESYDEESDFLLSQFENRDRTYSFEGYKVYQYDSPQDQEGELIATYDVVNDVKGIAEERIDPETSLLISEIVAKGTDSGIQQFHIVDELINYTKYYFGVQAYAFNRYSNPKTSQSTISRIEVTPARVDGRRGGTRLATQIGDVIPSVRIVGSGSESNIVGRISSPLSITGDTYRVDLYDYTYADTDSTTETILTYDFVNQSTGDTLINGQQLADERRSFAPFGVNIITVDGVSFEIDTAQADFTNFLVTANAAGPVVPPTGGAADFQGFPVPVRPGDEQQVGEGVWFYAAGDVGTGADYTNVFIPRSIRNGFDIVVPFDYEVRFTETCFNAWQTATEAGDPFATPADGCYAYDRFGIFGDDRPQLVPFELWNTGVATPNDESDDFRMIPAIIDWEGDGFDLQFFDSSISGSDDDPESDWTYWYLPCNAGCTMNDMTPGTSGYDRWQSALLAGTSSTSHGSEVMARSVFVNWNGGSTSAAADKADYLANVVNQVMPEAGTVFRLVTSKPLTDGDVFVIDTAPFAPIVNDATNAIAALSTIGVVPNPYLGDSIYEINRLRDIVRFTNLPERATIRVFSLAGTLIRQFEKNGSDVTLEWDLNNENGFPIASGMYLIHVEVPGVGDKVIKFGVIKSRKQLDLF